MTDELKEELIEFNGEASQAWCFLHVINLVGKTMVKAFDIPKDAIEMDNDLWGIDAGGLDAENWQTIAENGSDPLDNNNMDGWVDEITLLAHNEHADLEDQVRPVWIILAKVRPSGNWGHSAQPLYNITIFTMHIHLDHSDIHPDQVSYFMGEFILTVIFNQPGFCMVNSARLFVFIT